MNIHCKTLLNTTFSWLNNHINSATCEWYSIGYSNSRKHVQSLMGSIDGLSMIMIMTPLVPGSSVVKLGAPLHRGDLSLVKDVVFGLLSIYLGQQQIIIIS